MLTEFYKSIKGGGRGGGGGGVFHPPFKEACAKQKGGGGGGGGGVGVNGVLPTPTLPLIVVTPLKKFR